MAESNASSENDDEIMDDADADNDPDPDPAADQDGDGDAEDDGDEEDADGDEEETQEQTDTQMTTGLDNPATDGATDTRDPDGGARTRDTGGDGHDDHDGKAEPTTAKSPSPRKSASPGPKRWKPEIRPEVFTAKTYDVVPTMAAPQATSINAMAITPDLRYWMTGGSDGYIRKYSGPETINGKQLLTVAQRHPFVDSVVKAGVLVSYWENEEPPSTGEHVMSPVYSLAVHSQALWLLSGTESGGINLQSVRHDEGKRITCLKQHSSAVSVLTLAPDEKSVLSGSWDKKILDWDLNTGEIIRTYEGSGQISAIELRPASGAPFPAGALDEPPVSDTFMSDDNKKELANGDFMDGPDTFGGGGEAFDGGGDVASPAHESLFGGSDAGSLFGESMGGGFGGGDDDDEFSHALGMSLEGDSMNAGSGDVMMGGVDSGTTGAEDTAPPAALEESTGAAETSHDAADSSAQPSKDSQPEPTEAPTDTQTTIPAPSQDNDDTTSKPTEEPPEPPAEASSPTILTSQAPTHHDPTQVSDSTFLSASIDGTIRIWDRRAPNAVARITPQRGVPPWCMAACWSPSGNTIYAGRRNGVVEEFDIHKASRSWAPTRSLRFPAVSGAVSAIRPMPNGRHLMCASHDILRLYDLEHPAAGKDKDGKTKGTGSVPFLIVPGPPRAGVISSLWIDPTCRFMISAAGTRGWEGTCTEALIGYEISAA